MSYELVLVHREGAVATITINREQVRNALNAATMREIGQALREAEADDGVRVVLLTGAGEKAFVAGADIGELRALSTDEETRQLTDLFHDGIGFFIAGMRKPVIAVVNGYALGGGCELALACDMRLAADTARLGLPEITLGIMPGWGGTQRLARLAGPSAAKLIALSGEMVDAAEALRIGLVDRVYPAAELRAAAMQLAQTLAGRAPLALAAIKQAVNRGVDLSLAEGCAHEAELFATLVQTADAKEGTGAFLEKRKPTWQGR